MSPGPYEDAQRAIAELLSEKSDLLRRLREVDAKLEKHRVKCPTCRCRILPGRTCSCCAYNDGDEWVGTLLDRPAESK